MITVVTRLSSTALQYIEAGAGGWPQPVVITSEVGCVALEDGLGRSLETAEYI